jgi:hypothetical protein
MTDHENELLRYIMLSTAHLSQADALTLSYLSDQIDSMDTYTHEWIHNTGMHNGFLIRLSARTDALNELRMLGLSDALCDTLATLMTSLSISMIHFDSSADVLTGLPVYDW